MIEATKEIKSDEFELVAIQSTRLLFPCDGIRDQWLRTNTYSITKARRPDWHHSLSDETGIGLLMTKFTQLYIVLVKLMAY